MRQEQLTQEEKEGVRRKCNRPNLVKQRVISSRDKSLGGLLLSLVYLHTYCVSSQLQGSCLIFCDFTACLIFFCNAVYLCELS